MSSKDKPAPVSELPQTLIAKKLRARYQATLMDTARSRSNTKADDYWTSVQLEKYYKTIEDGYFMAGRLLAPSLTRSLALAAKNWATASAAARRTADAAQDYANFLQAFLPQLQLKDHDPEEAQEWASDALAWVTEAEQRDKEAVEDLRAWVSQLQDDEVAAQSAKKSAEKAGKK